MHSKFVQRVMLAFSSLMLSGLAAAEGAFYDGLSKYNLRPGITEVSQEIHDLHIGILIVCVLIGIAVFSVMFYSMFKHRKSAGHKAADFHENTTVEIVWTLIPTLIVIGMMFFATKTLVKNEDTSDAALTVKVTGSQWKWHYEYLAYEDNNDVGVGFLSVLSTPREQFENYEGEGEAKGTNYLMEVDNPLVIPSGQKVRFLITADDVIHAWFMPDFGLKKDAIPGFINELWTLVPEGKEGTYHGNCAELCGKDHAFMPVVVEVVPQSEFKSFLEEKQAAKAAGPDLSDFASLAEAVSEGEKIYSARCAACHQVSGEGGGPFPALKGSAIATGSDRIGEHIDIIVNGKGMMPPFKAGLSPRDIAAVVTYERNAWGNDTGDLVQPADVAK